MCVFGTVVVVVVVVHFGSLVSPPSLNCLLASCPSTLILAKPSTTEKERPVLPVLVTTSSATSSTTLSISVPPLSWARTSLPSLHSWHQTLWPGHNIFKQSREEVVLGLKVVLQVLQFFGELFVYSSHFHFELLHVRCCSTRYLRSLRGQIPT